MSTVPKARRPSDEKRFGRPADGADADGPRTIAVIDVGTSSIRMAVAETASGGGRPRVLEQLSQAVALGRDTFTTGVIGVDATEQCVRVLRDYLDVLEEYGVTDRRRVRVVATTAVREAGNRLTFIDRVFGATGLDIEAIEQAEVNRLTYLSVLPVIGDEPSLAGKLCCVVEVGGGSTEILLVRDGDIVTTATARLGTLRLRETLEQFHASEPTARTVMSRQIDRVARQLVARIDPDGQYGPIEAVVALGADVRFAARQLSGGPEPVGLVPLVLDDLASLAGDMFEQSENDLIRRLGLSVPSAETLRPALLAYVSLARSCGVDEVLVCGATLRDGLLLDLA
ncbi:MAG: exopolyphosphatase, partial [Planctomycetota bacterium]